jgi:hypothetical protein
MKITIGNVPSLDPNWKQEKGFLLSLRYFFRSTEVDLCERSSNERPQDLLWDTDEEQRKNKTIYSSTYSEQIEDHTISRWRLRPILLWKRRSSSCTKPFISLISRQLCFFINNTNRLDRNKKRSIGLVSICARIAIFLLQLKALCQLLFNLNDQRKKLFCFIFFVPPLPTTSIINKQTKSRSSCCF